MIATWLPNVARRDGRVGSSSQATVAESSSSVLLIIDNDGDALFGDV